MIRKVFRQIASCSAAAARAKPSGWLDLAVIWVPRLGGRGASVSRAGLVLLLGALSLPAQQVRATLSGTVYDQSGAVVAGAQVAATNTATNLKASAQTGADGRFTLLELAPGPYELSVEATGFRTYSRQGIVLAAGDKAHLDVQLEVGSLADRITVTGELTAVESNRSVMGQLMDAAVLADLPVKSRSFLTLIQLSTGTLFTARVGIGGWDDTRQFETAPNMPFSVHGSRPGTNSFVMDGAPLGIEGGVSYVPPPEAIEELKLVAPTSDASQGLSGGGVISLKMKSGTNELHGSFAHFLRNGLTSAVRTQVNRAAATRPDLKANPEKWNNPTAQIGFPIIKNKFFAATHYDGFRQRFPDPMTVTVPTLLQRMGDFSQTFNAQGQLVLVYDPLTTRQSGNAFVRDPFPGNRVPAGRMVPVAQNILKMVPAPNIVTDPVTNFYNYAAVPNCGPAKYDSYYVKLDYLWSQSHRSSVSGTQNWGAAWRSTNGMPIGSPLNQGADPRWREHLGVIADHTWVLNPALVLTARAAFDRWIEQERIDSTMKFDGSQLGFKGQSGWYPRPGFPRLTFTDYVGLGRGSWNSVPNQIQSAVVDFVWSKGKHIVKAGTRLGQGRYFREYSGNLFGIFNFTKGFTQRDPQRGDATSGNAIATSLLGYPESGNTSIEPSAAYQNKYAGLYFQDDIQLTPKLTLNLGLRWDVQTAPTERFNRIVTGFDPVVSYQLGATQARGGLVFADSKNRQPWTTNWRDFQPRTGLAYRFHERLVWRAGYGMSFLPLNGTGGAGGIQQTGFSRSTPLVATLGGGAEAFIPGRPGTGTLEYPFPSGILQPLGAALGPKAQVGQAVSYLRRDYVIPRVHQFHAGLGVELPWKIAADASFVGSRTRKFRNSRTVNFVPLTERLKGFADPLYLNAGVPNPFAGAPELAGTALFAATITRSQSLVPFPQFTGVTEDESQGRTSYNALELKINRRLAGGLMFTAAYTNAKIMQEMSYREPQYTWLERVIAGFDRPQQLRLIVLYDLPFGRGRALGSGWGPVINAVLGNWQITTILEAMSGTPLGMPDARPLRDPRLPKGQQSLSRYFNTCTVLTSGARINCASADEPVVWQQLRPNELRDFSPMFPNLRTPSPPQMNASVMKEFDLTERFKLEARAEAFNLSNTPIYGGPSNTLTSADFGKVNLDQWNYPRSFQFALKLTF